MLRDNLYLIIISVYALFIAIELFKLFRLLKRPEVKINISKYFLRINIGVLISAVVLFLVVVLFEVNFLNYAKPIPYSSHKGISLLDFKGFKQPKENLDGSKKFAYIKLSIKYYVQENSVIVQSFFHPSRSYTFNNTIRQTGLIEHEMYHFHITEYFARQFRKRLSILDSLPTTRELRMIYEAIINEEEEMQRIYDDESYHSYILSEQKRWEQKVDSLLITLNDFKNSEVAFEQLTY